MVEIGDLLVGVFAEGEAGGGEEGGEVDDAGGDEGRKFGSLQDGLGELGEGVAAVVAEGLSAEGEGRAGFGGVAFGRGRLVGGRGPVEEDGLVDDVALVAGDELAEDAFAGVVEDRAMDIGEGIGTGGGVLHQGAVGHSGERKSDLNIVLLSSTALP